MKCMWYALLSSCLLVAGCAFDVIRVKQEPAVLDTSQSCAETFVLSDSIQVTPKGGYQRELQQDTHWSCVGRIAQGSVFRSRDQILTAEASNIYEANLVISGRMIVGFYLPVESAFSPLDEPRPLLAR